MLRLMYNSAIKIVKISLLFQKRSKIRCRFSIYIQVLKEKTIRPCYTTPPAGEIRPLPQPELYSSPLQPQYNPCPSIKIPTVLRRHTDSVVTRTPPSSAYDAAPLLRIQCVIRADAVPLAAANKPRMIVIGFVVVPIFCAAAGAGRIVIRHPR